MLVNCPLFVIHYKFVSKSIYYFQLERNKIHCPSCFWIDMNQLCKILQAAKGASKHYSKHSLISVFKENSYSRIHVKPMVYDDNGTLPYNVTNPFTLHHCYKQISYLQNLLHYSSSSSPGVVLVLHSFFSLGSACFLELASLSQ